MKVKGWLKKVERVVWRIRGKPVLAAVSGGKDSLLTVYALKQLGFHVEMLFINLSLPDYSSPCQQRVEAFAQERGVKLHVAHLKDYGERWIWDFKRPCRYCGIAKRYIMNAFAYENGWEWLATGHNLDDELAFFMLDVLGGNVEAFLRRSYIAEPRPELKMVGRIKPLYYFTDREVKELAERLQLRPCPYTCPFKASTQNDAKALLDVVEERKPVKRQLHAFLKRLRKRCASCRQEVELKPCKVCSYPAVGEVCSFCRHFRPSKVKALGLLGEE